MATKWLLEILWPGLLIYIQEVIWIGDQGEGTPLSCALYSHTLELLLAFPYDWENETILPGALRHFKRYQTCIVTFCTYYIAWILGDEGRGENGDCSRSLVRTVSTGCETPQCAASWMLLLYARDSSRWLLTPGPHFLSRGAQTFWHRARAYTCFTSHPYNNKLFLVLTCLRHIPLCFHISPCFFDTLVCNVKHSCPNTYCAINSIT